MRTFIILLLLVSLLLAGCGAQHIYLCSDGSVGGNEQATKSNLVFHCPDGRLTKTMATCQFVQPLVITQVEAEQNAQNFVQGYVSSNAWQSTLIQAYQEEGESLVQLVIEKYD